MSRSRPIHQPAEEQKQEKWIVSVPERYPHVKPDQFERFAFRVSSRTSGRGNYRVYLNAYDWNGLCGCQQFQFRLQPQLERGAIPSEHLRCWHIKEARAYYLDEVGAMIEQTQKQTDDPQKGQTTVCTICKQPIKFNGEVWQHRQPKNHPALP